MLWSAPHASSLCRAGTGPSARGTVRHRQAATHSARQARQFEEPEQRSTSGACAANSRRSSPRKAHDEQPPEHKGEDDGLRRAGCGERGVAGGERVLKKENGASRQPRPWWEQRRRRPAPREPRTLWLDHDARVTDLSKAVSEESLRACTSQLGQAYAASVFGRKGGEHGVLQCCSKSATRCFFNLYITFHYTQIARASSMACALPSKRATRPRTWSCQCSTAARANCCVAACSASRDAASTARLD